jgi:hypothetical protein
MGHLAHVLRLSGSTHGGPPVPFLPSPGDVVPMVPDLVINRHERRKNKQKDQTAIRSGAGEAQEDPSDAS